MKELGLFYGNRSIEMTLAGNTLYLCMQLAELAAGYQIEIYSFCGSRRHLESTATTVRTQEDDQDCDFIRYTRRKKYIIYFAPPLSSSPPAPQSAFEHRSVCLIPPLPVMT